MECNKPQPFPQSTRTPLPAVRTLQGPQNDADHAEFLVRASSDISE